MAETQAARKAKPDAGRAVTVFKAGDHRIGPRDCAPRTQRLHPAAAAEDALQPVFEQTEASPACRPVSNAGRGARGIE